MLPLQSNTSMPQSGCEFNTATHVKQRAGPRKIIVRFKRRPTAASIVTTKVPQFMFPTSPELSPTFTVGSMDEAFSLDQRIGQYSPDHADSGSRKRSIGAAGLDEGVVLSPIRKKSCLRCETSVRKASDGSARGVRFKDELCKFRILDNDHMDEARCLSWYSVPGWARSRQYCSQEIESDDELSDEDLPHKMTETDIDMETADRECEERAAARSSSSCGSYSDDTSDSDAGDCDSQLCDSPSPDCALDTGSDYELPSPPVYEHPSAVELDSYLCTDAGDYLSQTEPYHDLESPTTPGLPPFAQSSTP